MCGFSHIYNVLVVLTFVCVISYIYNVCNVPIFLLFMDSLRSSRWPCLSSFFCSLSWPAPVFSIYDPLHILTIPVLFLFVLCCFRFDFLSVCFVPCLLCPVFGFPCRCSLLADQSCHPLSICCPVRLLCFCPGYVFRPVFHSTNATFFVELVPKKKFPSLHQ
jgi:hypothetical protein